MSLKISILKKYIICVILLLYLIVTPTQKYPGGYIIPRMYKGAKMSKTACIVNFPTSLVCYQRERHYFKLTHQKVHEFQQLNKFTKEQRISRNCDQKHNLS